MVTSRGCRSSSGSEKARHVAHSNSQTLSRTRRTHAVMRTVRGVAKYPAEGSGVTETYHLPGTMPGTMPTLLKVSLHNCVLSIASYRRCLAFTLPASGLALRKGKSPFRTLKSRGDLHKRIRKTRRSPSQIVSHETMQHYLDAQSARQTTKRISRRIPLNSASSTIPLCTAEYI